VNKSRLEEWWVESATKDAEETAAKLAEYGAADLVEIGHMLATVSGKNVSDQMAFELGVLFYAYGKIWRIISSMQRGPLAKDDSWFDLHVYAKMVMARRSGAWPNEERHP
jgi:hypothetical protein